MAGAAGARKEHEQRVDRLGVLGDPPAPPGPPELALVRIVPNPVRDQATLRFTLPRAGRATLAVSDAGGRLVRTLANGQRDAGEHTIPQDVRNETGVRVAGGIYFLHLQAEDRALTARRAVLN